MNYDKSNQSYKAWKNPLDLEQVHIVAKYIELND